MESNGDNNNQSNMRRDDIRIGVDGAYGLNVGANDWDAPLVGNQPLGYRWVLRRWNRLSRMQRSLISTALFLTLVVGVVSYYKKCVEVTKDDSLLYQDYDAYQEPIRQDFDGDSYRDDLAFIDRPYYMGPTNERQNAVVKAFKHAWTGYRKYAWGHDNLRPASCTATDWFTLGLTIVDSMDTAYIMGLHDEYDEARQWVRDELVFTRNKDVNFFEVTIRVLGSLLTNYHLSQDNMFLEKAHDLGERLMAAYSSPSGIPYSDVNLGARTAHAPEWSHYSTTAEVSTVQLEFRELSRATGNPAYEAAAAAVSEKIHQLPKKQGLVPIFINPNSGQFLPHATITLGARGDSYYEYLLKQWVQTGKTIKYLLDDYLAAIEGVQQLLARRSFPSKLLFIGELAAGSEAFTPKMDHLTCFLPGTLALGHAHGLPGWHMKMAEELLYTCYLTYKRQPTFLAPEITHFNMGDKAKEDMYVKSADAHNLLRPEFVESLWYMYQITGNSTYQDWGWQVFLAIEKHSRLENGYTSISNVQSVKSENRDMLESFFLSETLKYLYLLLSEDRYLIDLTKFVINSEAHALPIHRN